MKPKENMPSNETVTVSPSDVEFLLFSCEQVAQRKKVQRALDCKNKQPIQDAIKALTVEYERYEQGDDEEAKLAVGAVPAKLALTALEYVLDNRFLDQQLPKRNAAYGTFVTVRTQLEG